MVQQGGVSVNGKKVDAIDATFGKADFDDKDRILLKKGKKKFCQIKVLFLFSFSDSLSNISFLFSF